MNNILTEGLKNITTTGGLTVMHALTGLTVSFVLTFFLALIYKKNHSDKEDCHVIMQSMIFISIILAGAMMIIGNNLAIAFGLVGAVSIIRFRTSVRSYLDMSFIFVSIVVGMASGLGFYFTAFLITFFVGGLMLILNYFKFGMSPPSVKGFEISLFVKGEPLDEETLKKLPGFENYEIKFNEYKITKNTKKIKFTVYVENRDEFDVLIKSIEERFKDSRYELAVIAL